MPLQHFDGDFKEVDSDRTGYAVCTGDLRINEKEGLFELELSAGEMSATMEAIRAHDETPDVLVKSFDGTTFRGDYPALDAVVDALKYYENFEAGLGEDKLAYDTRTAFNHARGPVRDLQ